jgi:4-hydroxy-tetrahydrodipicolinate synthase
MLAVGAQGVVSVVGNLVPKEVIRLVESYARGDRDAALQAHYRLFPLCRDLLSAAPNPIPVKTALALLGRGNGEMRLPLCAPDESTVALLRRTLVEYGLIKSESK